MTVLIDWAYFLLAVVTVKLHYAWLGLRKARSTQVEEHPWRDPYTDELAEAIREKAKRQ